MLWRRLDTPGHDACRLTRVDAGWQLDGAAVFLHDRAPAQLAYLVACDDAWRTQRGEVRGWIGAHAIDWRITGDDGAWSVNGEPIGGLDDCIDLDFGFTPATNLLQIRRVMLPQGVAVELPVRGSIRSPGHWTVFRSVTSAAARSRCGTKPRASTTKRCSR